MFHADANPAALSEWGVLHVDGGQLHLGEGVVPYTLRTPLFTDYAHKLRTIWIPHGERADYNGEDVLDFPVGTIISKTFYYPSAQDDVVQKSDDLQPVNGEAGLDLSTHRLIETRLLVRRDAGWEPISYVWNDAETDAKPTRIGALIPLQIMDGKTQTDFTYAVPNINQCAACHAPNSTTRELTPLGPKPRWLNMSYDYADGTMSQMEKLAALGWLETTRDTPIVPAWDDSAAKLNDRARGYMDMNCAHCHNPVGPADTSGLHLNIDNDSAPHLGICKQAIAAGGGTGGRKYDIQPGNADGSITHYRMLSRDPGAMMPELGRSLTHVEGAALIADWINSMEAICE